MNTDADNLWIEPECVILVAGTVGVYEQFKDYILTGQGTEVYINRIIQAIVNLMPLPEGVGAAADLIV